MLLGYILLFAFVAWWVSPTEERPHAKITKRSITIDWGDWSSEEEEE